VGAENFVWYSNSDDSSSIPPVVCSRQEKPADVSVGSWNGFARITKILREIPIVP
jgi:hypothetical protein